MRPSSLEVWFQLTGVHRNPFAEVKPIDWGRLKTQNTRVNELAAANDVLDEQDYKH